MSVSCRPALTAALALALLLPAGGALALDQASLAELEGLLRELGFDPGAVDGVVDADTIAAIRRYQHFALLPGPPEPTARLLDELRGVAAAYSALNADKTPAPEEAPEPEKAVVPPPPPPPKLTAEVGPEAEVRAAEQAIDEAAEAGAAEAAVPVETLEPPLAVQAPVEEAEPPEAIAALPPVAAQAPAEEVAPLEEISPAEATAALPPVAEQVPVEEASPAESDEALEAAIEAELLRFRHELAGGSLTREELARRFNAEGRRLLQQADYDAAVLKFSVAIHLDPGFAGAYSNRGTAYRHREEAERAEADFAKAKELGFGGLRLKDSRNPLN